MIPSDAIKISVVVPIHNEQESIFLLIDGIIKSLHSYQFEIIIIDDGSTDGSNQSVFSYNDSRIVLIELRKRYGQSIALATGINYTSGDYIITMDGDLQNDPKDIPLLLKKALKEKCDLVTGIRTDRKDKLLRILPSQLANAIVRLITSLKVKDLGCGLKVFTSELAKSLNFYGEQHRYITLIAHLAGAKIFELPIKHHPRRYGKSKYGFNRTYRVIGDLIIILFQKKYLNRFLRLFGQSGVLLCFLGLLIGLYLLFLSLMGEHILGTTLFWIGLMFVFLGIHLFSLGLLYNIRIRSFHELKSQNTFHIKKITTLHDGS